MSTSDNVLLMPASENMTPKQALQRSMILADNDDLREVIIVGYDSDGGLVVESSKMDRKSALWIVEQLRDHVLHA